MIVTIHSNELKQGQLLDVVRNGEFYEFRNKEVVADQIPVPLEHLRLSRYKAVVKEIVNANEAVVEIITSVPLHTHTGYSLLDGAIRINDLVKRLDYAGAITDHGAMYGFLDFYKKMREAEKKPIIGMEAYVETIEGKKCGNHLVLLAENEVGYKNLIKLSSAGFTNVYRKPHVSIEALSAHSEGIIALSACLKGEISETLCAGDREKAKAVAKAYIDIFGPSNFFIEIQRHGIEEEMRIEKDLIGLANDLGLGIVGTTDAHYLDETDKEVHEVLLCIQTQSTMDGPHMKFNGNGYHLHSVHEMENLFADIPEALENSVLISERCDLSIVLNDVNMPHYEIPCKYESMDEYFRSLCYKGFEKRYSPKEQKEYLPRLEYEIDMVLKMGFAQYFVIVWDFLRWAREHGIMIGPGRGSAAGSVAAYCLRITDIDPMKYDLFFERFLNPERISWPDIDSDVEYDRRGEVIDYITHKYGKENVCKIITFGTMAARMVVKDVTRAMGLPASFGGKIAKLIPAEVKMSISKALKMNGELQSLYETDESVKKILDISQKLEGLPRHASQHACGVVISPSAVEDYLPTAMAEDSSTKIKEQTSQVTMSEVEELGLLKMDILGLKTMGVIGNCFRLVKERYGVNLSMDMIDLSDRKIYQFLRDGNTGGVFQFESNGMTDLIGQMYADVDTVKNEDLHFLFERAIAAVSLYRPGPMDYIPLYIQNMNDTSGIVYDHESLKPILEKTYGVIVYQEQVMQIVQKLAGYSLGRADVVRKAMGKKKEAVMAKEMVVFINGSKKDGIPGCKGNGISEDIAMVVWGKMKKFAEYAFNKSHATAYAYLSIITAYLSLYYPNEFRVSLLNAYLDSADKQKGYIAQCLSAGLAILPPDVNKSEEFYSLEGGGIRFGFRGLKAIDKISATIVAERGERGIFTSIQDFIERMVRFQMLNKKAIEALVYSGSFDGFGYSRRAIADNALGIMGGISAEKKTVLDGQVSLFEERPELKSQVEMKIINVPEMPKKELLMLEKEFAGYYISGHPLDQYINGILPKNVFQIGKIFEMEKPKLFDIQTIGIVSEVRKFYTKETMDLIISFKIEDRTHDITCVLFSDCVNENAHLIVPDTPVVVKGNYVVSENWGPQIIAKNVMKIDSLIENSNPKSIVVTIRSTEEKERLFHLAHAHAGEIPLIVDAKGKLYRTKSKINYSLQMVSTLQEEFSSVCANF